LKIALIIENSQAAKSQTVHAALKSVAEPQGHTVSHYGMYGADDDASLTYVMNGLLAGLLINSGAADFIVILQTHSYLAKSTMETRFPCLMRKVLVGQQS